MTGRFRQGLLWAALAAIVALAGLSICGAFLGARQAQVFFNCLPLAAYWLGLTALLIVGTVVFARLTQIPSLLLMHLGCIVIVLGGMWGSKAGHAIQERLFGVDKLPQGELKIYLDDRTAKNDVRVEDGNGVQTLPFSVRLDDFKMPYYERGDLIIYARTGDRWRLPAREGARLRLGEWGKITIRKVFNNLKLQAKDGRQVPYDAPGGPNPAVQVLIERPNGTVVAGYVFEDFGAMFPEPVEFALAYVRQVKDYISRVEIIENGKPVAARAIEVNHPLHYRGYHVYQHSVGEDEGGPYTVLLVVSDSGLNLVYAGYIMLIAGVFWHFWGRRALIAARNRRPHAAPETGRQDD